ncbi:MAG: AMP-binding protein, partial [Acidobacteriota bacterium]|nr:AMP-binding protein [Acidobacteriota bacterium]
MMPGEVIVKTGDSGANMADYARERESFTWSEARRALEGLPGGGLNMAHEALVRHARGPRRDHVALRCLGRGDERIDVTFAELDRGSNRFANVLSSLGVGPGERVFVLLPRDREL